MVTIDVSFAKCIKGANQLTLHVSYITIQGLTWMQSQVQTSTSSVWDTGQLDGTSVYERVNERLFLQIAAP